MSDSETNVNRESLVFGPGGTQAYGVRASLRSVRPQGPSLDIPLEDLSTGYSPRTDPLNRAHIDGLIGTGRATAARTPSHPCGHRRGTHRLAAAKYLRMTTVRVVLFDGTEEEARIEAIRSNNSHGLPLTPPDRKRAATYLINQHVDWSDGRIAEICSISPKMVAALRRQMAGSGVTRTNPPLPGRRLGRDGRRHPIDQGLARARAGRGSPVNHEPAFA